LAEAFNAYLYGESSLKAWSLPRLGEERDHPLEAVIASSHHFVLAHELGHIVCGHVKLPQGGGAAQVTLSPQTELEADRFAVDLVVNGMDAGSPLAQFVAGGMLNVLVVASALETLKQAAGLDTAASGTHPALPRRWEGLAGDLEAHFPDAQPLVRGAKFCGWLRDHLDGIATWLRRVDDTMKRPGGYD
jgi:hypothetical protein